MTKQEHPQAKWLRAIADGEQLQVQNNTGGWFDVSAQSVLGLFCTGPMEIMRIKPRTITIGKYEVAEPMRKAPMNQSPYWLLCLDSSNEAVHGFTWDDTNGDFGRMSSGQCWTNCEDAELAAKAISELLNGVAR